LILKELGELATIDFVEQVLTNLNRLRGWFLPEIRECLIGQVCENDAKQ
jgi:hypothetical protein